MIDAIVVTGDKLTIQLIENIQRSDLSPKERERGIFLMTQNGLSQKEVAARLSKSDVYVSRHISAHKVRQIAEATGIDTSALETSAISEIQTVKEADIPMVISYIIRDGGTKAAAREIMKAYRPAKPKPEEQPAAPPEATIKAPADLPVENANDVAEIIGAEAVDITEVEPAEIPSPDSEAGIEPDLPPEEKPKAPAAPRSTPRVTMPRQPIPHGEVDVNDIFDEIYSYISTLEERIRKLGPGAEQSSIEKIKQEAAWDIIALIHKRLDLPGD
jgi:transcriptional regulator with XRE-family HTH domain